MAKVVVKIHGGLGNQMFQYVCGKAVALKRNEPLRVDPSSLFDPLRFKLIAPRNYALSTVFAIDPPLNGIAKFEKIFRIPYVSKAINKYYPKVLGKIGYWKYIKEADGGSYTFDPSIFDGSGNRYLEGYWQTEKYFKEYEDQIRKDFSFRAPLAGETAKIAEAIKNSKAVCINVRRQEVIRNPFVSARHNVLAPDYYEKAIAMMKQKVGDDAMFFVISDEIDWCRENMKIDGDHQFIGDEHYGVEFRDALQLMSLCKHSIIPNSSFAWWGAWLSSNKDKVVIAPKKWNNDPAVVSKDILPANWIGL